MLDKDSIPNCMHDARIDLNSRKKAMLDILSFISDNNITDISHVSGAMWTYIDEIDNELEPE